MLFWYLIKDNKVNYNYETSIVEAALSKLKCESKKSEFCCGGGIPTNPKPSCCGGATRKKRQVDTSIGGINLQVLSYQTKK